MSLDLDFVRSQYPVYQQADRMDWAFFENAGGSYVPRQVIDRLTRFFVDHKVQPYGPFEPSQIAGREMDEAYQSFAELLNTDVDDLTFGPSTTLNFYVLAQGLRSSFTVGDEIVVTNQDHEANIGCWRRLSEFGVLMKEWRIDKATGELDLDDLRSLVSDRTKLVCFPLCSNIIGTFNDATAISEIAKEVGALVVADGVSYAPHQLPDVSRLGVDFYAFSTYKTFGTHLGLLWSEKSAMETVESQGHYFNDQDPHYRLNPTGPLHAEIAAVAGVAEYLDELFRHHFGNGAGSRHERAAKVFSLFAEHETALSNQLLEFLTNHPRCRVYGQQQATVGQRAATISFSVNGMPSRLIAEKLAENKIATRAGSFYAVRCIQALGLGPDDGVVRISIVHYNTREEVDRLIQALAQLLEESDI